MTEVARDVLTLVFCGTITVFLGLGYYNSLKTGVLTVKNWTSRRDHEPTSYWLRMISGALALVLLALVTAIMAFFVYGDLSRH